MSYLEDGWVLWSRSVPGTTQGVMVYAQLYAEKEGARSEIIQLVICGRDLAATDHTTDLTTDKLRSIPVAHIETLANTNPDFRPHLAGTPQLPISEAFDRFRHHASQIMLNEAHRKAKEADEADRKAREPRQPLARPDGSNPDAFYQQVAEAYRDVLQTNRKVAKALADEANVPVGTVHRWVLEARRRGFLPPARQGRAG
jgi:hypothetical protein